MGGNSQHPLIAVARAAYEPAPSLEQWVDALTRRAARLRETPGGDALFGAVARILDQQTRRSVGGYFIHVDDERVRAAFEEQFTWTEHRIDFLDAEPKLHRNRERFETTQDPFLQRMRAHFAAAGVHDMVHLTAFDGDRHWVTIGLVTKRPISHWSPRSEAMAGAHFATALRLQSRAFALSRTLFSARTDAARERPSDLRARLREGIRELVEAPELPRCDSARAVECWRGLLDRSWSLVDVHDHGTRRYIIAMPNPGSIPDDRGLAPRESQVAAFVAEGCTEKWIARTLGLADSTVANHLRSALDKLGLPSQLALAQGFRRYVFSGGASGLLGLKHPEAPAMPFPARGLEALALTGSAVALSLALAMPERGELLARLSPRERVVVDLAMAGLSDKEIAERLGRSRHTVSNQLRRAYARLNVNSRVELGAKLRSLAEAAAAEPVERAG